MTIQTIMNSRADDETKAALLDRAHVLRQIDDAAYHAALDVVRPTLGAAVESDSAWLARQTKAVRKQVAARPEHKRAAYIARLRGI